MTTISRLTCLAAAAALCVPANAHATVCNLITDPTGDGRVLQRGAAPNDPALDVVSGDFATNTTYLTTVVRLDDLGTVAPPHHYYTAEFTVHGFTVSTTAHPGLGLFQAHVTPGETRVGNVIVRSSVAVAASGVYDASNDEVRVHVLLSDLAPHVTIASGDTLADLEVQSNVNAGVGLYADPAPSSLTYTSGDASCVTPGV